MSYALWKWWGAPPPAAMRAEDRVVYDALGTWAVRAHLTAVLGIPLSALGALWGLHALDPKTGQEALRHLVPAVGTSAALAFWGSRALGVVVDAHSPPPRGLGGPASWYTRASEWMFDASMAMSFSAFVMTAFTLYAVAYTAPGSSLEALFALGLPTLWLGICGNPNETRRAILRETQDKE